VVMISDEKLSAIAMAFTEIHGEMKKGMIVKTKHGLAPMPVLETGKPYTGKFAFVQWVNSVAGGQDDHPLHFRNFVIGDCIVIAFTDNGCVPCLMDSRFLEPVIEQDETPRQLELPLDARQ
jgi:hypothetical protein